MKQVRFPEGADFSIIVASIRKITTQAFFRRMNPAERNAIRTNSSDPVQDLREDLQRSLIVNLDGVIEQQLIDTGGFTQTRIDELLVDGTEEETTTG